MHLTDEQFTIAALSQAIADQVPQALVWQAWAMAQSGSQFDAAISATIQLNDICEAQDGV